MGEEDIMLDMEALTKYNGKGRCKNIILRRDREEMYRKRLRDWARDRDWSVEFDHEFGTGYIIEVQRLT